MSSGLLDDHRTLLVHRPNGREFLLQGGASTGKTTAPVARLLHWAHSEVAAGSIMVIVFWRTVATHCHRTLPGPELAAAGQATVLTVPCLVQRMVDFLWPLTWEGADIGDAARAAVLLTLGRTECPRLRHCFGVRYDLS
jgi:hypothetical protein